MMDKSQVDSAMEDAMVRILDAETPDEEVEKLKERVQIVQSLRDK